MADSSGVSWVWSIRMKLPFPFRVSMNPASLRSRRACRTVMRLTPIISINSFSLGSISPF